MKNRTDEYWELIGELGQPPKKLEGSVQRARKRARRARLMRRLATPVGTLAAAAACFVLMVNAFPTFALACSEVPILRELTAAVALSPSLSAAVEHDYVQYIGQSQTIDGVTVNLEYAIVDKAQAVFFYSVDGARFYTTPSLTDENGEAVWGYGASASQPGGSTQAGSLDSVTFSFTNGHTLPDRFTMEMFFLPDPEGGNEPVRTEVLASTPAPDASVNDPYEWTDPREDPGVLSFFFSVALDPNRIFEPKTVEVNRWAELDGQRIKVDRLEYFPTRTILYLAEDPANTAWLKDIKFWFEDETGALYDNLDGSLSASGTADDDSESMLTYYFQSFYYDEPKGLTLCIDKAEWLDKDAPRVFVDLTTGEGRNLPEGLEVGEITRNGENVKVEFRSPPERGMFSQTFSSAYWDPEGGEHYCNRMAYTNREDGPNAGISETLYLDGYPWDTVELELLYTSYSLYEQPIYVPLTPRS